MSGYRVGYIIGSLSSGSINRRLAGALIRLAPKNLNFVEIPIRDLPLYNPDFDTDYPPAGRALKDAIATVDAMLFVTPEYNRGIPGCLKNAIDWASRPYGMNSFAYKPSAVMGASPGKIGTEIGTAVGQQSLRSVLNYCNSPLMGAPEAYIQLTPGLITEVGQVADKATEQFLRDFIAAFEVFVTRVLTVLPPERFSATAS
jgi:chromate reductase